MNKKIGIIGLGTVGEAVLRSLRKYNSLINKRTSLDIKVKKVCDQRKEKKSIASKFSLPFTKDPYELIDDPEIDIIVELIGGINPARQYVFSALKKGKDVVTANKALLAECGKDIFLLAKKLKRNIGFEAAVGGAIPLIRSISEGLVGCEVSKLYGIVNGTTNYILSKMDEEKMGFYAALGEAQKRGFAERRPQLDIEGVDSLHKISILSYLCFGLWPAAGDVYVEGISKISLQDILYAQELSYKIKLLAIAKREGRSLDLRIHPTLIPQEHQLAQVNSVFNAVWLEGHPCGELLFYGEGAGGVATSSSIISDVVNMAFAKARFIREKEVDRFKKIDSLRSRYYIRFLAQDRPGVLANISKVLGLFNISIANVTQKGREKRKFVPIVMVTHEAKEKDVKRALTKIDQLPIIKGPSQVIRIENL
ncbi:MAG: homoserine dehydrogenase [Candidatus Omnitrophota bacterium]